MYEKQLGEKIKKLRIEKGLSQEKFALLIDMDRTYFATVEMGKRNVSLHNIEKIAGGLGISISELLLSARRPRLTLLRRGWERRV